MSCAVCISGLHPLKSEIAPLSSSALMAHYAGDEHITPEGQAKDDYVGQFAPPPGMALVSLGTDLPLQIINSSSIHKHKRLSM